VKLNISKRARLRAKKIDERWRQEADYPNLLAEELLARLTELASIPQIGSPWPTERRPHLKRLLLEKTQYHVYFEVNERKREIRILAVWGARRGRTPKM
jgi:plasmid stabilization system protein ParE